MQSDYNHIPAPDRCIRVSREGHIRPFPAMILVCLIACLSAGPLSADSYRWKDKDGKIHYGAVIPAEYADQPYDVLNDSGVVIKHVEDTSTPKTVIVEQEVEEEKPDKSIAARQLMSDQLLLVQYRSEEEILKALEVEITQLGYEARLINQSYESTGNAIRDQIRQAADQQRANQAIDEEQRANIRKLYARYSHDKDQHEQLKEREEKIRARFQTDLERYRKLTSKQEEPAEVSREQG